ncbi:MAG: type 1 glutamine amidotransferase-like domain-containing protein [Rhodococcus sp.]|nr:type 1 glutamine amidotransferase-like domain-containing protein [Rhodococcus sp. (in: high G+C Gram-positive bacteria)]
MRLFLSSYRFGANPDRFRALVDYGTRVAVIAAAADAWPATARASAVVSDIAPLRRLGYQAEEVDLREFVGCPDALADRLAPFRTVWVRGGNTFVLRAQMARSGADEVIRDRVRSDSLVYAGYSAGACVATPTLLGLDASDDPGEVRPTCAVEPLWEGLGFVDFAIVPHYPVQSTGESDVSLTDLAEVNRTITTLRSAGIAYRTLTDDETIVVDGDKILSD